MITKNSSGTNLSANYSTTVAVSPRQWQAQLYVNGSQLSCGIKRLTIRKGSCGNTEAFSIGNVYSSMMTAELLDLSTNIKAQDIEVRIGLNTGSMEWITVGKFTAIDVVKTVYSTSVTGYGFSTSKTSGSFVIPQTLSLANIASAITTATGKTITFDTGINTGYVLTGTIDENTSCYGGLQILAHAVGGYAVDTYDGNFAIHKFSNTSTLSVSTDRMKSLPNVEELTFSITGVQVTGTGQYEYELTTDTAINPEKTYYTYDSVEGEYVEVLEPDVADIATYYEQHTMVYTYGSPINLIDENPNMSASVFNIYKGIVGYSFYTGTIDLSIGDPRIEGNDVLTVTDVNSSTYTVPCHIVSHHYDGGLSTTIQAVKASSDGDGLASGAPISQQIDQISVSTAIAKASAESALADAESARQSAEQAQLSATQAEGLAQEASDNANIAKASADSAVSSAGIALNHLGIVENVVGVLDLISQHGDYQVTQDTEVIPDKWYFTRSGSGTSVDPYIYTVVQNPSGDPSSQGWYEIIGIDEAIQNYVSSQLAVDSDGLWLQTAGMETKVLLSATDGVVLYGPDGAIIGKYGSVAQIGDGLGFHIDIGVWYQLTEDTAIDVNKTYYTRSGIKPNYVYTKVDSPDVADIGTYYEQMPPEIGFYDGDNKVAYVSNQQLYITQSVVLQRMDVGIPAPDGLGQWSWRVHEYNGQNNLYLKWVG